jgi:hypothetical protein
MRRLGQNCSSTARSMRISLPVARSVGKGFNRSGARQRGEQGAVHGWSGRSRRLPWRRRLILEHGQGGVV